MAIPLEKLASIDENSQLEENAYVEDYEEGSTSSSSSSCGCFGGLWFRGNNNSGGYLLQKHGEIKENWFAKKARRVKESSEVLCGPKWKNFIRKFCVNGINNQKRRTQFQYDPQSYALNFDDGIDKEEDSAAHLNLMARYVAPVGMNKG